MELVSNTGPVLTPTVKCRATVGRRVFGESIPRNPWRSRHLHLVCTSALRRKAASRNSSSHTRGRPGSKGHNRPNQEVTRRAGLAIAERAGRSSTHYGLSHSLSCQRLRVRWQLGRDGKLTEPKTPPKRQVDLGSALAAMLREHRLASLHSGDGDFVFSRAAGGPSTTAALSGRKTHGEGGEAEHGRDSQAALAGSPPHRRQPPDRVSPEHQLVSRTLRRSDAAITLRVYGHLFDREQHAVRAPEAMDAAIERDAVREGQP